VPDDEFRYELDDGVLIVSPAPSTLHQRAVTRLTVILSAACPAKFEVFAGVGVNIIPSYWIAEPDMDHPELIVFELRSGASEQTAHVTGDEEYRAEIPFPVTTTPAQLVSLPR
jgi:Uma2 family endonuclease